MNSAPSKLENLRIDRKNVPRGGSRKWIVLLFLLLVSASGAALAWINWPETVEVRTLVVEPTSTATSRVLLNASGYVTARREATVASKVTGKVMEVMVEEGMKVERDQVLAKIDSSNVEKSLRLSEAQLESARKSLEETRTNLDQAELDLRRTSALAEKGVATQAELDQDETDAQVQRAKLERQMAEIAVAEREVAVWKQQLEDTIIRAPFAGIVTSKDAQPGEIISPMSAGGGFTRTGICTIVDMDSLEIEVDVNESYINRVEPGQAVLATLDSYPDWKIPAKVTAIIPTADRQKATVKVRVAFEELDPRILPDMSVKVAFQSGEEEGTAKSIVVLPKSAVHQVEGRDIVWVARDNRVERRAVRIESVLDDQVSLSAGVNRGEKVVIEANGELAEGRRIREAEG